MELSCVRKFVVIYSNGQTSGQASPLQKTERKYSYLAKVLPIKDLCHFHLMLLSALPKKNLSMNQNNKNNKKKSQASRLGNVHS